MQSQTKTPDAYVAEIPVDRRTAFQQLRECVLDNIPGEFQETMSYGMIGYVVPHSLYPDGYHCDPKLPLPFVSLANQKNFIALYHMGMYAMPKLMEWFVNEFPKHSNKKLDMGKSCIRFKKPEEIPFELIGQLMQKISVKDWIECYETETKNRKR